MPSSIESLSATPSDESSLSPAASTDAVFAEPVDDILPIQFQEASSTVLEQSVEGAPTIAQEWQREKQAVSVLDPIRDVYDHVKIFFASRSLAKAERRFQQIEAKSDAIQTRGEKLESAIQNSKDIEATIGDIRQNIGLDAVSQDSLVAREAGSKKAGTDMAEIENALLDADKKLNAQLHLKIKFEKSRDEARNRIISRIEAKAVLQESVVSNSDEQIVLLRGRIDGYSQEIANHDEMSERLTYELATKEFLPEYRAEVEGLIDQLSFKKSRAEEFRSDALRMEETLVAEKEAAQKNSLYWRAKIAPKKPDLEERVPDIAVVTSNEVIVQAEAKQQPNPEKAKKDLSSIIFHVENTEVIENAKKYFLDAWFGSGQVDRDVMMDFLLQKSREYQRRGDTKLTYNVFANLQHYIEQLDNLSPKDVDQQSNVADVGPEVSTSSSVEYPLQEAVVESLAPEASTEEDPQKAELSPHPFAKPLTEAVIGAKDAWLAADDDERDNATRFFRVGQMEHERNGKKEGNFFKFFLELMKLFAEVDTYEKGKKSKPK